MNTTTTLSHEESPLEHATLAVVQQFRQAGLGVERKDNPDAQHIGHKGHCSVVELAITHKNGASCRMDIKHLNDFEGGLRAILTFPVEGTGTSSVTTIREEDPSPSQIRERLTALASHAITALSVFGKEDSLSDLRIPR